MKAINLPKMLLSICSEGCFVVKEELPMSLIKPIILFFVFSLNINSYAQYVHPWDKYLDELTTSEDGDIAVSEDVYDVLSDLYEHPLNINTASREDLTRIPFLSAQQIEDIQAYVYRTKGLKSLSELALIESLDPVRRNLLSFFLYVGYGEKKSFPSLGTIFKYGKNELLVTGKIPFYDRHGDKNGYLGPKYRHSFRYDFSYGHYVKMGLLGSQDAGEPFFTDKNHIGYDHYSYYIVVRDLGRLKALALGQYKLRLGMGLVMNSDFGFGKLMTLNSLGRSTNSIRANTSRSTANYLQGAASTVTIIKGLDATAFVSYRPLDATLNKSGYVQTILKSGYHRTISEMNRKNNVHQFTTGGNLHWDGSGFHVGFTAIYSHLDKALQPNGKQSFRRYYPEGNNFWNASVDYGYINHRLSFNGETATGNRHGIATINSLSYLLSNSLSVIALQRFYSKKYSSLFSSSFSSGGRIQNESGIYLGANWQAFRHLNVLFYTDYAYFAQPRYQVSRASHCWDNVMTMTWINNRWTILGRYQYKVRQKDDENKTALVDEKSQRGRLSLGYGTTAWSMRLQGDAAYSSFKDDSFGWMTTLSGTYGIGRFNFAGTLGYFNTDDFASRIYNYERGPLYSFSFPAFYGEGIRYALFARVDLTSSLLLIAKCGITDYFDRDHISSGLQQIDHSSQTDLELQVKWKF